MTTVSSVIKDAMRETNLIGIKATPTTEEYAEGLSRLQNVVLSVIGNEMGENLVPLDFGQNNISAPTGYPWYGNSLPSDIAIPQNVRLMMNLTGVSTINLPLKPDDGARVGVVDASNNLGTYNITLRGNGRTIEGSSSLTLSTNGLKREWIYRADLGDWMRLTALTLTSDMPFPQEFDDMFVTMLAMRLNPRYGQALGGESVAAMKRSQSQFRARYHQKKEMPSEEALLRLSGAGLYLRYTADYSTAAFNTGYPYGL